MPHYETSRSTSLETSVRSGSVTTKETVNEYSVPFGNHSQAPHLITGFTVSNMAGGADTANGDYTLNQTNNTTYSFTGPNGHQITGYSNMVNAGFSANHAGYAFLDGDDFDPFAEAETPYTGATTPVRNVLQENNYYPWEFEGDFTGIDPLFSDFVGSDI